jgi:dipeptidyl aminopeptidase/acylaminoacyl peptidase
VDDRTLDDTKWVVSYIVDNGSPKWYLYDRNAKQATLLFAARRALEGLKLSHMYPQVIKSRDGLDMVCYLTLPPTSDLTTTRGRTAPAHGAQRARRALGTGFVGYRGEVQWLANRGYAVLQVNYRGSTGFGKEFVNKANREWGGKMHDDLMDAVKWAWTTRSPTRRRSRSTAAATAGTRRWWG